MADENILEYHISMRRGHLKTIDLMYRHLNIDNPVVKNNYYDAIQTHCLPQFEYDHVNLFKVFIAEYVLQEQNLKVKPFLHPDDVFKPISESVIKEMNVDNCRPRTESQRMAPYFFTDEDVFAVPIPVTVPGPDRTYLAQGYYIGSKSAYNAKMRAAEAAGYQRCVPAGYYPQPQEAYQHHVYPNANPHQQRNDSRIDCEGNNPNGIAMAGERVDIKMMNGSRRRQCGEYYESRRPRTWRYQNGKFEIINEEEEIEEQDDSSSDLKAMSHDSPKNLDSVPIDVTTDEHETMEMNGSTIANETSSKPGILKMSGQNEMKTAKKVAFAENVKDGGAKPNKVTMLERKKSSRDLIQDLKACAEKDDRMMSEDENGSVVIASKEGLPKTNEVSPKTNLVDTVRDSQNACEESTTPVPVNNAIHKDFIAPKEANPKPLVSPKTNSVENTPDSKKSDDGLLAENASDNDVNAPQKIPSSVSADILKVCNETKPDENKGDACKDAKKNASIVDIQNGYENNRLFICETAPDGDVVEVGESESVAKKNANEKKFRHDPEYQPKIVFDGNSKSALKMAKVQDDVSKDNSVGVLWSEVVGAKELQRKMEEAKLALEAKIKEDVISSQPESNNVQNPQASSSTVVEIPSSSRPNFTARMDKKGDNDWVEVKKKHAGCPSEEATREAIRLQQLLLSVDAEKDDDTNIPKIVEGASTKKAQTKQKKVASNKKQKIEKKEEDDDWLDQEVARARVERMSYLRANFGSIFREFVISKNRKQQEVLRLFFDFVTERIVALEKDTNRCLKKVSKYLKLTEFSTFQGPGKLPYEMYVISFLAETAKDYDFDVFEKFILFEAM